MAMTRRDALPMIAIAPALALWPAPSAPEVMTHIPYQLTANGIGWAMNKFGEKYPVTSAVGHAWVQKVDGVYLNDRKQEHVVEYNMKDGWVREMVDEKDFSKAGIHEITCYGKVEIKWK